MSKNFKDPTVDTEIIENTNNQSPEEEITKENDPANSFTSEDSSEDTEITETQTFQDLNEAKSEPTVEVVGQVTDGSSQSYYSKVKAFCNIT